MKTLTIALLMLTLAGCATRGANYVPVVDTKYKDPAALQNDTRECQQYALQRANAEQGAVVGALVGALLGAALAPRGHRNYVAGQGAIIGGVGGAASANETQEVIIKRCLAGRGYNVLN